MQYSSPALCCPAPDWARAVWWQHTSPTSLNICSVRTIVKVQGGGSSDAYWMQLSLGTMEACAT